MWKRLESSRTAFGFLVDVTTGWQCIHQGKQERRRAIWGVRSGSGVNRQSLGQTGIDKQNAMLLEGAQKTYLNWM